jgi:hypothetical protein
MMLPIGPSYFAGGSPQPEPSQRIRHDDVRGVTAGQVREAATSASKAG